MTKKIGIMQPYFFPYIGYFQLINSVDEFVIYDNIKYTKKGWINRNRVLVGDSDQTITLTLKKAPDHLNIVEREISTSWEKDKNKILNVLYFSYHKAPHFEEVNNLVKECLSQENKNLFEFLRAGITQVCKYLEIKTPIITSSSIKCDHSLKSQEKVIAICESMGASVYINSIGGTSLYSSADFIKKGIDLKFIKSDPIEYDQLNKKFVPWLSIIDVMMFNPKEKISAYLKSYKLI